MSEQRKRETHAAVIAEMREIHVAEFQDYADRLEAAHEREVAQLRAALEKAEAVIDCARMMVLQGQEYDLDLVDFGGALAKCREALAATETKGEQP